VSATSSHYHVVVVGTDLAGLVYAAICAKRGYRVLVVGHGASGPLYEQDGHVLCRRLELQYGLQSPIVRKVFDELHLGLELRNLPRPLDPAFQVVLPKARLSVTTNPRLFDRELRREFPGSADDIATFSKRLQASSAAVEEVLSVRPNLPPAGLVEAWKFRGLVKKYPILDDEWAVEDPLAGFAHGHPFRAFAAGPYRMLSGMLPARPYPASFVRIVTELWKGTAVFDQGPTALRDLFLGKVAAGDVRPKAVVQQIEVKRGKAHQVILRDRREAIGCELVVCNTDPKRFAQLIPQEQQQEDYHHVIHTLQPIAHTFVANFVVQARAIPEAMGRHVFAIADLSQSLEEDNCIWLARDADVGPSPDDRELRLLTAAMRVPISVASGGAPAATWLLDRIQRRIEDVLPFLQEHLVYRHTPWLRKLADGSMDIDPAELQPCYGEAIPQTLGLSPLATATGYKNILMGGDASFCGLGGEGPYLAALNLLQHTTEKVPLRSGF
jgi:phytoene dehydrogenase-like protein